MDAENINELFDKYSSMTDEELQAVLNNHGDDRLEVLRAKVARSVLEQRRREAAPAPVVTSMVVRQEGDRRVVITDVRIPFWSMVNLLVTVSVASIPACFIFWLMWMIFFSIYEGCTYGH